MVRGLGATHAWSSGPATSPSRTMVSLSTPKRLDEEADLVFGAELGRMRVVLSEPVAVVGTSGDCSIYLPYADVSPQHAELRRLGPATYQLSDLGSRHGTFVNDSPVRRPVLLALGDSVRFGTKLGARLVLHDPTQERLERRRRLLALGRLIGGISNELCNMAAVLLASSDLLAQTATPGDPGWHAALADVRASASRAARLTTKIMDVTSGRGPVGALDVSRLCADVTDLAAHTMGDGVNVAADIAPALWAAGSSLDLELTLLHLCLHACCTLGHDGTLTVRAERGSHADTVCITIRSAVRHNDDRGERVRDPRSATVAALALADIREVLGDMGGSIREQAHSDGWGCVVEIPAIRASTLPAAPPAGAAERRDLEGSLAVLVVDDDPSVRRGLCRLLRRAGHEALEASSGAHALELHRRHRPDAVLIDVRLQADDGGAVLDELRRVDEGVRVVMMTGTLGRALEADLLQRGAAACLTKPCTPAQLFGALRAAARRS